ncbi:hypothetical protein ASPZODRAFT_112559 [Penicilliopsis zonata CBS 506.65]|uniref:Helicase SWR1 n=1 Tax=Penicilliopsis zonata CBS 506.65 TaxID=1073090 RepID=A0A1L9SM01_9EURO|nr:hypothetical protein ASPZODRAFT_112559 [Penicilliopsis zonata CBS 506.65]OJJ48077.1 hypothetical protein ASPZODRAFT_112559 [Penicilliopsis zonata CBS 506.65]
MQNGSVNGTSQHHERVTPDRDAAICDTNALEGVSKHAPPDLTSKSNNDEVETGDTEGPPSKKRKLVDSVNSRRSTPRPPSPPWKKVGVEGPTSFIVDGRRKSSRTNTLPVNLQPSALGGKVTTNGSPRNSGSRGTAGKRYQASHSPASQSVNTRTRSQSLAVSNHHLPGPSPKVSRFTPSTPTPSSLDIYSIDNDATPDMGDGQGREEERSQKLPRLRFKVKKPSLSVQHPAHVLAPRKYTSFREWLESEDRLQKDDTIFAAEEAAEEARKRQLILDAVNPGGLLSPEVCSAYLPEQQEEPPQQYSHQDHLVAHAIYFKKLLDQEHKRHRNTAKLFAQWCADAWRKRHKDPEDILREQQEEMRGRRKQLAKDLQKMFDLVRAEVDRNRLARWEEERKVEDQQALDRAIKKSTMLFEKRRKEILGETEDDDAESSEEDDDDDEDGTDDSDSPKEDESNMSSTDSESEEDDNIDDDAALTADQLRMKYANLPSAADQSDRASILSGNTMITRDSVALDSERHASDVDDSELDTSSHQIMLDEVDPMLLDDSEESTDMDDDMGDSDADEEVDEDDDDESDVSDDGPGLLGFFSSKELVTTEFDGDGDADDDMVAGIGDRKSLSSDEDDEEEEEPDEVSLVPNGPTTHGMANIDIESASADDTFAPTPTNDIQVLDVSEDDTGGATDFADDIPAASYREPHSADNGHTLHQSRRSRESSAASPGTFATKPSEPESISSLEPSAEKPVEINESPAPALKTQIPHLLRGTLREYQHFGLDWLAGLYTNQINGILADEMGLGKTIQTIALLAHLAVEHEVWGPHLVVVPTSVILNWEMEFKKWCPGFKIMTYYGNQDERRAKRKGWMDDNSWNVLITSYQLVLQDQQVLKRRNWHYMVLDEAHNIKNFRSQRWQALLTFRTRARLLLTGTPLQNNLTELWSLLFFLMPSDGDGEGIDGFADLRNFSEWFRRPVEQILEHGRETMDDEAKRVVTKLHTVLRPYILRRLKADVEKQMPAKYEHVVYCRLSKRQRYLYDGFMSRAQTKETLASGNYLSIINCLMQLRKVCNHPDLFETRQISTSFAMTTSVTTEYEIKDLLVRRRLLYEHPLTKLDLDFLNLVPISRENISRRLADDSTRIMAYAPFQALRECQYKRTNWRMGFNGSTIRWALDSMENSARKRRMQELEQCLYFESKRHGRRPVYGSSLIEFLTADNKHQALSHNRVRNLSAADWLMSQSSVLASMVLSIEERAREMEGYVQRFACVTPAAVAAGVTEAALTPIQTRHIPAQQRIGRYDPFHEAQMRLSIAFPDKRLLQYDCGKLQRLDKLLRDLKAGGHRALIFTQMTKMLDILEQFLNIHGHRYLRLDGTTKVEQRQILTDRFNNDNRILAFILSSRSGGLGINLTGADTVIFYDLDWNPAMDKQCQDRCHRIGQTRDVHIYRFVSEYTIESNILRKANQKRMLDDVVIQEGEFTTDYFNKLDVREMIDSEVPENQDEASAAMDRVLDNRGSTGGSTRGFEQAEDKEDIDAAKNAQKELDHADDGDFEDRSVGRPTESTAGAAPEATAEADLQPGHVDEYLLRFMEWHMKDEPLVLPADKSKKKSKRGHEHRLGKRRR